MNLASLITGRYDFHFIPIALPTPYIISLLPTSLQQQNNQNQNSDLNSSPFLSNEELISIGLLIPSPPIGKNWVIIECGKQIGTGMKYIPGGKSDFFEAKLQIPFLKHPSTFNAATLSSTRIKTSFTYKQTLIFSSSRMSFSGSKITGLSTAKGKFTLTEEGGYDVESWFSIAIANKGNAEGVSEGWSEELVKSCLESWWFGERTGQIVTRFSMTSISPPIILRNLLVRLHLPSFSKRPLDTQLDEELDDGWIEVEAQGWKLSESTTMEAKDVEGL